MDQNNKFLNQEEVKSPFPWKRNLLILIGVIILLSIIFLVSKGVMKVVEIYQIGAQPKVYDGISVPEDEEISPELLSVYESYDDEGEDGLVIVEPYSMEWLVLGSSRNIKWSPNDDKEVNFYLERFNSVTQEYEEVGKMVQTGYLITKYLFPWSGLIEGKQYPETGTYYIKIVEKETGRWDRTDDYIVILPLGIAEIKLTVNGEATTLKNPLIIDKEGGVISVEWESAKTENCNLTYSENYIEKKEPVPSSGSKDINFSFTSYPDLRGLVSLTCDIANSEGQVRASGNLRAYPSDNNYIRVIDNLRYKEAQVSKGGIVEVLDITLEDNVGVSGLSSINFGTPENFYDNFENAYIYLNGNLIHTVTQEARPHYNSLVVSVLLKKTEGIFCQTGFKSGDNISITVEPKDVEVEDGEVALPGNISLTGCLESGQRFREYFKLPKFTITAPK